MADTTYTSGVTVISADTMNDLNRLHYTIFADPADLAAVRTTLNCVISGGALGTPSSGTLTNCTGLPVSTGISGLGANVAAFLATPSSANFAACVTGETGIGSVVFSNNATLDSPTFVTPALGTPASGVLTNCTGTASGLTAGSATSAGTENSWTPTLTPVTSGSITISASECTYSKNGNMVQIAGRIAVGSVSSPNGQVRIGNLPFTAAQNSAVAVTSDSMLSAQAGVCRLVTGTTYFVLRNYDGSQADGTQIQAGTTLYFSGVYKAS